MNFIDAVDAAKRGLTVTDKATGLSLLKIDYEKGHVVKWLNRDGTLTQNPYLVGTEDVKDEYEVVAT